jgi:hypothetical protein
MLGLAAPGEGHTLWKDGHAAPGGRLPINTNGGGLSFNHSGMYGMPLLIEAYRQLSWHGRRWRAWRRWQTDQCKNLYRQWHRWSSVYNRDAGAGGGRLRASPVAVFLQLRDLQIEIALSDPLIAINPVILDDGD